MPLVGQCSHVAPASGIDLIYRESGPVDFRRVFEIDTTIDTTHVIAGLSRGLHALTLPKAETAKPRRIEINGLN